MKVNAWICARAADLQLLVSLRTAEDEQEPGICCSRPILKLEICKIQWLLPFKPLEQVITPRGPFMVSIKMAMKNEPNIKLRCCSTCSKTLVFSVKIRGPIQRNTVSLDRTAYS